MKVYFKSIDFHFTPKQFFFFLIMVFKVFGVSPLFGYLIGILLILFSFVSPDVLSDENKDKTFNIGTGITILAFVSSTFASAEKNVKDSINKFEKDVKDSINKFEKNVKDSISEVKTDLKDSINK